MRIAILEEESEDVVVSLRDLRACGHEVKHFSSPQKLLKGIKASTFDLVILGVALSGEDPLKTLKQLRLVLGTSLPLVFAAPICSDLAMTAAFEAGATEYWIQPLRPGELLARANAILRRLPRPVMSKGPQTYMGFTFVPSRRTIKWKGGEVQFTSKRFELARFLFENCDLRVSRKKLAEQVWGDGSVASSRVLDANVSSVRRQLGLMGESDLQLNSVYGMGYELVSSRGCGVDLMPAE